MVGRDISKTLQDPEFDRLSAFYFLFIRLKLWVWENIHPNCGKFSPVYENTHPICGTLCRLETVAPTLLSRPELLTMMDLSFNKFTTVPNELDQFPLLNVLYLHGNGIRSLAETDKLSKCKKLRTLTVHGNPLDKTKDFRLYIIAAHTSLKALNFTSITDKERERSLIWRRMNSPKKKRSEYWCAFRSELFWVPSICIRA